MTDQSDQEPQTSANFGPRPVDDRSRAVERGGATLGIALNASELAEVQRLNELIQEKALEITEAGGLIDKAAHERIAEEVGTSTAAVWTAIEPLIRDQRITFGRNGYHAPTPRVETQEAS